MVTPEGDCLRHSAGYHKQPCTIPNPPQYISNRHVW